MDAVGMAAAVRAKQVTPLELVDAAIARIEAVNPKVNAVVTEFFDKARARAKTRLPDGPLAGVPYLIKDLNDVKGERTTNGSRLTAKVIARANGTITDKVLDAGMIILGKTNTPEFGLMASTESVLLGPCRNPWNTDYSTGGSSGGAAAATASGMVPAAHASDGGGSIRIPASACGVFGLKPTRARNPVGPDRGQGWAGFSCGHVVSISVRDSAAMLDALCGPELTSPYHAPAPERPFTDEVKREPGRLRVAFTAKSPYGETIDPEIAAAVRDVAALLDKLGHHVEERAPVLPADPAEVMAVVVAAHTAMNVRLAERRFGRAMTNEDFEILTLAMARNGQARTAADYVAAELSAFQISRALAEFFTSCDVFLSPTLCAAPLPLGELNSMKQDVSHIGPALRRYMPGTSMFNMSGQPAMSVPLAWNAAGLPLGMMFASRFGDEATLLRLAAQLEQERPWRAKLPPTCADVRPYVPV
jgi:amidase/6-aminohexanoate-cyclic-dimer hydrolase